MALGPGRYDEMAKEVLQRTGANGVLLIVVDGINGNGAACKLDAVAIRTMPAILRDIADNLEEDIRNIVQGEGMG